MCQYRGTYTHIRLCYVNTAVLFPADNHVLVYWPEENAVTPVYMADVKSPALNELREGVVCTVKHRSNVFEGIVAAIGMYLCMHICTICNYMYPHLFFMYRM